MLIRLIEEFEIRNLIAYNQCIVNSRYLDKVGNSEFENGQLRKLDIDYLFTVFAYALETAIKLDSLIVDKFNIDTVPLQKVTSEEISTAASNLSDGEVSD